MRKLDTKGQSDTFQLLHIDDLRTITASDSVADTPLQIWVCPCLLRHRSSEDLRFPGTVDGFEVSSG